MRITFEELAFRLAPGKVIKSVRVDGRVLVCEVSDTPDQRHAFTPDKKYPWFCGACGYAEHEALKHLPRVQT